FLDKQIVWSAKDDLKFTFGDLIRRVDGADIKNEEWSLLKEHADRVNHALLVVQPLKNEEFEEIAKIPEIKALIQSLDSFDNRKKGGVVQWLAERSTLILLRTHSRTDGFGVAIGLNNDKLYKIDLDAPFDPANLKSLSFHTLSAHRTLSGPLLHARKCIEP